MLEKKIYRSKFVIKTVIVFDKSLMRLNIILASLSMVENG